MGKHEKEVNCPGCDGHKTVTEWRDGEAKKLPCPLCNGSGKQPS